ncbi:MAG: N-acetylmuramoyl-L-alanine amidase [Clostridia bacterium]|nr:N-acetylmuramoyl-L-alanine amidase [Clostridia bacterium]
MKRYLFVGFTLLIMLLIVLGALLHALRASSVSVLPDGEEKRTVIIDAGHGGEDCGAVGVNGSFEKDINFAVSNMLSDMLKMAGFDVILTRTEDKLLYTEEQNIKGKRKIYDLKNRLAIAEENPDAIFISIHMNKFPIEKYSGLQVYYSENTDDGKALADAVQRSVSKRLQPDNNRKIKKAGSGIYLLDKAVNTAILIECGFMSNGAECERLSDKDYQRTLSFCIFCGIIEFVENKNSF